MLNGHYPYRPATKASACNLEVADSSPHAFDRFFCPFEVKEMATTVGMVVCTRKKEGSMSDRAVLYLLLNKSTIVVCLKVLCFFRSRALIILVIDCDGSDSDGNNA